MKASFSFALNPQWHVSYVQSEDEVSLALTLGTAHLAGDEEALFQAYMAEALLHIPERLVLLEVQKELDHFTLRLGAVHVEHMYADFQHFWQSLRTLALPEPPPLFPQSAAQQLEHQFLAAVLCHTPYAERIESPELRGMASVSMESLLAKMPLQLFLHLPGFPAQSLTWLQTLCEVPWVYREPVALSFHPHGEPIAQECDYPLPGVWIDVGFRMPGHRLIKPVYLGLVVRLFELIWQENASAQSLLLREAHYRQWEYMGYLRFRFYGEDPQSLTHYQHEIMDAFTAFRHHALTESNFQRVCQQGISEPVLFSQWYQVARHYVSASYCCWLQSLRLQLFSSSFDALYEKYPLLGYVDPHQASEAIGVYKQQPEVWGEPGRQVFVTPTQNSGLGVELLFHGGTLFEKHGASLPLLGQILCAVLQQRLETPWTAQWDHHFLSLETTLPWKQLTVFLTTLKALTTEPLATFIEQVSWTRLKKQWGLRLMTAQIEPFTKAYEVFLQTAFPNHPYSRLMDGTYQSLSLVQPHHLEALWQVLKQRTFEIKLSGQIPIFLQAAYFQPVFESLPPRDERALVIPDFQGRRGVIYADLPEAFSLMGRACETPNAEDAFLLLQLEQRVQRLFQGTPIVHEVKVFEKAWCLLFWGYDTTHWLQQKLELLGEHLPQESVTVFESYYLSGADWIHVCRAPHRASY